MTLHWNEMGGEKLIEDYEYDINGYSPLEKNESMGLVCAYPPTQTKHLYHKVWILGSTSPSSTYSYLHFWIILRSLNFHTQNMGHSWKPSHHQTWHPELCQFVGLLLYRPNADHKKCSSLETILPTILFTSLSTQSHMLLCRSGSAVLSYCLVRLIWELFLNGDLIKERIN